ncbi:MAG: response regulator [Chloroflexota bacterium]|nr:MAG: response regulator [Chloroflexota bacterium]
MDVSVLVATSTSAFGMIIKQALEDSGRYRVSLAETGEAAIRQATQSSFDLCILDFDLPDASLRDLVPAMRSLLPKTRLVIVPPNNDLTSPEIAGLTPDDYLTKPFYLPDLLDTMDEILKKATGEAVVETPVEQSPPPPDPVEAPPESKDPAATPPAPDWLKDVTRAAQHLTRLTLESAAQAALIVHEQQLWAYAGELSQPASLELAQAVANFWARDGGSDLARFVRLESNGGEYMLYATGLGGNMVLALVFDAGTPFSKIRSQAVRLARALSTPPGSEPVTPATPGGSQAGPATVEQESERGEPPASSLPPLFDDVPPPSPTGWRLEYPSKEVESDLEQQPERQPEEEGEKVIHQETFTAPVEYVSLAPQVDINEDSLAETRPTQIRKAEQEATPAVENVPEGEPAKPDALEPATLTVCNLSYACMLLPRLPKHHLTGDLSSHLTEWVAQLCIAFGWRLEHLALRPDYLLWVVNVNPSTSPSYLMRIMRQHTSLRIFNEFPTLARENPSGDFWAPGYLIMSSIQPPPMQVVRDFIKQTRHRQGASRPIPRQA